MPKDRMSLHGPYDRYVAYGHESGNARIYLKPEFFEMSWDDQMMDMRRVVHLLKPPHNFVTKVRVGGKVSRGFHMPSEDGSIPSPAITKSGLEKLIRHMEKNLKEMDKIVKNAPVV